MLVLCLTLTFLNDATCAYFSFFRFFLCLFVLSVVFWTVPVFFTRFIFIELLNDRVCRITATNYESFFGYLSCTFLDPTTKTADYSLYFVGNESNLQDARRSHVRVTLDLLMYRRNERGKKKIRGAKKIAEHTLRVSLLHSPTGQHYYPLSLYLRAFSLFFSFSTVLLLPIEGSSGWRFPGSLYFFSNTNLVNDRTLNYLRGEPAMCLILRSFNYLSLLRFSLFFF